MGTRSCFQALGVLALNLEEEFKNCADIAMAGSLISARMSAMQHQFD